MRTLMSKRRQLLIVLAVIAIVALSITVVRMTDRSSSNPLAGGIDNSGATPTIFQERSIPELTSEEKAAAVTIAMNDPTIKDLLANQNYSITSVGVWHTEDFRKIGAGVIVTFPEPISFEHDVPSMENSVSLSGAPPYQQLTTHVNASGVRLLTIMVLFDLKKVVRVTPIGTDVRFADPRASPTPEP